MEGRKIVATTTHDFIKLTPAMAARLAKANRAWDSPSVVVKGYDTSLPDADIEASLTNHFSSCGEIIDFQIFNYKHLPIQDHQAIISIWGEGAEEKALELNGSDMGGFKLVVVSSKQPVENSCPDHPVRDDIPRGYMIPDRFINPKKTSHVIITLSVDNSVLCHITLTHIKTINILVNKLCIPVDYQHDIYNELKKSVIEVSPTTKFYKA
ncbi:nucleolin 1-like [Raphanus sativus]|nr:nucleolin 1-like [Raphanus sativus]